MRASAFPWLEPFDDSPAELYLKDRHNRYLWLNRQAARVAGVDRDAVIGRSPTELFPAAADTSPITATVVEERRAVEQMRSYAIDGVSRWFDVRHTPVPPERTAGHGWCVLVHAVDVTAQVQLAALNALVGLREREPRPIADEAQTVTFVRLLLHGAGVADLCAALDLNVDEATGRLAALAGTPLR
ncbi:MAG: PAS domain-containing protein [Candidatus Binatia bacterium]